MHFINIKTHILILDLGREGLKMNQAFIVESAKEVLSEKKVT